MQHTTKNVRSIVRVTTIMMYSSTPYVGMAPEKMVAILGVHKWHALTVCVRLVKGLNEQYQGLTECFHGQRTIKFAVEYR